MKTSIFQHISCHLLFLLAGVILTPSSLSAQSQLDFFNDLPGGDLEIFELEFIDQPIAEIIISLAQLGKLSLLPDQNVTGRGSYYFRKINLEQALYQILNDNNLHLIPSGPIWIVSPMGIWISEDGSINLEVEDIWIADILKAISKASFIPIRFSSVPAEKTSLHIKNVSVEDIVNILFRAYPEYQISNAQTHINIVNTRNQAQNTILSAHSKPEFIKTDMGLSIYGKNIVVTELLRDLFSLENRDILVFNQHNPIIQELRLTNRTFREILTLIGSITGLYYREHLNVFAFFQGDSVIAPALLQYSAMHHSPMALIDFLPAELMRDCKSQIYDNSQTLLLTGQADDCNNLLQILHQLDIPQPTLVHSFDTSYINSNELFRLLPSKYSNRIQASEERRGQYYAFMTTDEFSELKLFLDQVDIPENTTIYTLQYLNSQDVIANLPLGIPAWRIQPSSDPRSLYVVGNSQLYERFRSFIEPLDQPPTQTQYHVLIIQYHQNSSSNYSAELKASVLNSQSREGVTAEFSQVLNLNFDIISAFGYGFAADLSFDISSSKARILVDNLLRGEDGRTVHFENTSTYRYRELADDDKQGVIRELTTGFIIDIDGRSDNNGFVHMDILVQLSKQGTDSSKTGTPPPTSKRQLKTSVNAASGTPVRIAGIVLREDSNYQNGIFPLGGTGAQQEISEFVIYILPFSIPANEDMGSLPDPNDMYRELVKYEN